MEFNRDHQRQVALKVVDKKRLSKQTQQEKILKEISIHKKLEHSNIVALLNFFEDKLNIYLVLEFCANSTLLHQIHTSEGSFSIIFFFIDLLTFFLSVLSVCS